ncbi:glucose-1-phosphate adenylyltransferase [Desulfopila sp. IMCC35006]|uniref:glucose-1-phosphate adenylyltransferase n=1 Tax=Desulfopila sp. IMCC35006 TaxID=2569542 RepID=UPI0010AD54C1|nr:glucose-1-phosphate adenylyltransferase [Desulfopila sp. IMCC35006]TKB23269.1 glucose-1-phosphate adenylyltransferase [Desulfopila sp. IMCC35006]
MQNNTLTFLLAGGVGSRLYPLTSKRSKPAVPFGGKYRIIDFTLANCLHSGLRRILVLTQYKSHSLNKHLRDGWSIFNPELGEYITAVPAQMNSGEHWYQGTADAIFQNLNLLERSNAQYTLILSGDHIYRMDYAAMLSSHQEQGSDVTIACMEVPVAEARAFGVVVANEDLKITAFEEKPSQPTPLPSNPENSLVSMGLYVFSTKLLSQALRQDQHNNASNHDFGKDILPLLVQQHKVHAYKFGGVRGRVTPDRYWRDVGTLDAYYEANMDLLKPVPPLNLYQCNWPIRTYQPQSPPARSITGNSGAESVFNNSILAGGVVISGGNVRHSILFHDVIIDDTATIEKSILFAGVHVGAGARLQNCIVDQNVNIPPGEQIGYDLEKDRNRFTLSDKGIVVIPKDFVFSS